MNDAEYKSSISYTIGKVKTSDSNLKKTRVSAEVRKRVIVGIYVLTWYCTPMYVSPFVQLFTNTHFCWYICLEAFEISTKEFEKRLNFRLLKHTFVFLAFFILSPKFGPYNREILTASSVT